MALQIEDGLRLIIDNVSNRGYEIIPIEYATKRVIAQDIIANFSLPPYNNSAMDGYGVKLNQINKKVKVIKTVFAGDDVEIDLNEKSVIKIMTGAKVPNGIEAIVPFELATIKDDLVILPNSIKQNQHIRFVGEDIKEDNLLINIGKELNFADISLLSSQGISHIKVYTKPKVALFTSGNELKMHFENKTNYQIFNSNIPSLIARLKELNCEVNFIDIVKDDKNALKEMFKQAINYDLIITAGGISKGEADFIKDVLADFDYKNIFDGISIKPGKPVNFGKLDNSFILNLPGNPLAASLIFEFFGKIIIQRLKGDNRFYHNYILSKIKNNLKIKGGRDSLVVGNFDGEYFIPADIQAPGMVGVLYKNNSFILVDKSVKEIKKNTFIKVLPIEFNFLSEEKKDIVNGQEVRSEK